MYALELLECKLIMYITYGTASYASDHLHTKESFQGEKPCGFIYLTIDLYTLIFSIITNHSNLPQTFLIMYFIKSLKDWKHLDAYINTHACIYVNTVYINYHRLISSRLYVVMACVTIYMALCNLTSRHTRDMCLFTITLGSSHTIVYHSKNWYKQRCHLASSTTEGTYIHH